MLKSTIRLGKRSLAFILVVLFGLFANTLYAQTAEHLRALSWRNIGPGTMSGRITAIACDPKNPHVIYAGAASGGVWRSRSGGTNWEPIFDAAPTQSVGAIAIHPQNPDLIWVGTGEGNPRNSQNFGVGIFKSIDGGRTWQHMGLEKTRAIHRVLLHRDNPDVVWVAALGSSYGPTEERGVYKSTDGGRTWRRVLFVNNLTGCAELVADPSNPNKLFAAMWEYQRWPWYFKSGGPGSGLYVSYDGGETWEKRTERDGLPKGELGRIGIAIARSKPNVVYALIEAEENALYRSDDGGRTWRKTTSENVGGRPFYYSEIYVDPKNENRIYSLHTYLNRSEDGGKTFETWIGWKIHVDHHAFWIHPENPDYIINGNDGGLNITYDGGRTWRYAENIPVGQFYHINVDNDIPYNVYGGLQDNGSWVGPSAVWRSGGIRNFDWQEVLFGDGFDVVPRRDDNRYLFAMSQGGELHYVDRKTGHTQYIKPLHPEGIPLRFHWNAPIAQDPFRDGGIYYGSQFLHYSPDYGQTWEILSPDLTTNDTTKQNQRQSGGLTPDVTHAENHCTLLAIAPSPLEKGVIWVGTDDGNLQLTRDGGRTWQNLTDRLPDCPKNAWIPHIEASTHNPGEAFVIVNNYRQNDWRPFLYHTTDYGRKWKRLVDEDDLETFCLSVVQDPQVPELLFLGTDQGLYFSLDYGKHWTAWPRPTPDKSGGLPAMPVQDMKIHPREGDLILGTFGRGIWILDNLAPLREMARMQRVLKPLHVLAPQTAYLAAWRSYSGPRFAADATYEAPTKTTNARIPVWINPSVLAKPEKEEETQKKTEQQTESSIRPSDRGKAGEKRKEKATVFVLSLQGDTLRRWKAEVDTGFNYITWNLDTRGVDLPSNREPEADRLEPGGGPSVLPGTYRIIVRVRDLVDSTLVTVQDDPRLNIAIEQRRAKAEALRHFYSTVERANQLYGRLRKAEKTLQAVENALTNAPDSLKKEILERGKVLRDSIAALKEAFFVQKEGKGIQRSPDGVNSALNRAITYINASPGAPNATAQIAIREAEKTVSEIEKRVENILGKTWNEYRQLVERTPLSLFQD
ncbi:MAG: hypothetical protein NZM43_06780 [Saprospiraceae bacterium]|nr:hypothetical protein [Saprospiraceae bacterium]MDW8484014.1 hypothetical protein [Saprospiraceae bacterium]